MAMDNTDLEVVEDIRNILYTILVEIKRIKVEKQKVGKALEEKKGVNESDK